MRLPVPDRVRNLLDNSALFNAKPLNLNTISFAAPHKKYTCVHYGIMIPNLPEPFRFLNMIMVVGQPRLKLFRNQHLIQTTALDTANVLVGSGVSTPDFFNGYSVQQDCDIHADGSFLKFGQDLTIQGSYPNFRATRETSSLKFELNLTATDKIAHFAKFKADLYDHWAILCQYDGFLEYNGQKTTINGLCTFEYARSADINLPFKFFTYQILNINASTQVLLVEVLGPLNTIIQRRAYIRSLDDYGQVYTKHVKFTVYKLYDEVKVTPDGDSMRMPQFLSWRIHDDDNQELLVIDGHSNNDFCYGMAAGFAGSYQYTGRYKGDKIQGNAYIEYIDHR